jgi:hypothetical protein
MVRHHSGTLWIACHLEHSDWKQPLAAPKTWTPLFFLDDAVALAAGHRPCGLCRRKDYLAFRSAVVSASGSDRTILAPELNRRLSAERHRSGRGLLRAQDRILWSDTVEALPTGSVVVDPITREPNLVTSHHLQPFTFNGWGTPRELPRELELDVLTPPTSVAALTNGFVPILHPTAAD